MSPWTYKQTAGVFSVHRQLNYLCCFRDVLLCDIDAVESWGSRYFNLWYTYNVVQLCRLRD